MFSFENLRISKICFRFVDGYIILKRNADFNVFYKFGILIDFGMVGLLIITNGVLFMFWYICVILHGVNVAECKCFFDKYKKML